MQFDPPIIKHRRIFQVLRYLQSNFWKMNAYSMQIYARNTFACDSVLVSDDSFITFSFGFNINLFSTYFAII